MKVIKIYFSLITSQIISIPKILLKFNQIFNFVTDLIAVLDKLEFEMSKSENRIQSDLSDAARLLEQEIFRVDNKCNDVDVKTTTLNRKISKLETKPR